MLIPGSSRGITHFCASFHYWPPRIFIVYLLPNHVLRIFLAPDDTEYIEESDGYVKLLKNNIPRIYSQSPAG